MGNPNWRKNPPFDRCLHLNQPDKTTVDNAANAKLEPASVEITLLLTDRDMAKLGKNVGIIIKGTARRSGCKADILPKKEGSNEQQIVFTGSQLGVTKAKNWIKERLV
ncbi:hypothetical protein ONS96_001180 [Cadophora gregata f. sp. sojae]|nr:hypothetical protein ONS96_001180 [Cadophora gregata f. sp. sojae]